MSNYSDSSLELEEKNTTWAKVYGYVPKRSVVLDVGCSDGRLGVELKKRKNCIVYGIEIDAGDFAAAKKVLDGVFDVNIETHPLPRALQDQQFDVIVLADVIEHFADPSKALIVLKQLLRPGGRIVFSVPNMSHISVRLQLLGGRLIYNKTGLLDHTHLHFYDYTELRRVLTNAGLIIKDIDANTLPYPPAFLAEKLSKLGLQDNGYIAAVQKDRHAQTFQFVGYCKDADKKELTQLPLSTTTPEYELTAYIEELKKANDYLNAHTAALEKQLQSQSQELTETRRHLETITNSRLWKVSRSLRGLRKKLRPKKQD